MTTRLLLSVSTVLLVACAGTESPQGKTNAAETAPGTSSAQRAYIDPETGELTKPPADAKAANSQPAKPSSYSLTNRPDGIVELRPKQPARHAIKATQAEDGTMDFRESDDEH